MHISAQRSQRRAQRGSIVGAAILSLLAVSGCTTASGSGEPGDDTIVWAVGGDAVGLDPQNAGQEVSQRILLQIYEQLVMRDNGVDISPGLASSYEQPTPTTYDFTIREGVTFSNGRLLTVDDVVGSFERLLDPDLGSYLTSRLSVVESVSALDDTTVRFELSAPSPDFIELLAESAASIMPIAEIESGELDPTKETLGTGPYVVEDYQKDNSWKLVANENYWKDGLPKVANLEIQVLPDEGTLLAALRSGSADIVSLNNSDSAALVDEIPGAQRVAQQNPNYYVLILNSVSAPALQSVETRQAINLALDRSALNDIALGSTSEVVGPLPDCPADELEFSNVDTDRAEQLLEQVGDPGPIELSYDGSGGQDSAALAQAIQAQLGEVGLEVELVPLPLAQFIDDILSGNIELSLSFYTAGTYPYVGLVNWEPSLSGFTSGFNASVPAIAESLSVIAGSTGDEQAAAVQVACAAIDEDSAQIPLVSRPGLIAWRDDLIEADILERENGGSPLRNLASFSEK